MVSELIACPRCGHAVDPQAQDCPACGVNLAIAAALAESEFDNPADGGRKITLTPEVLVPRLGEYLIDKGLLAPDDLDKALAYQKQRAAAGDALLLGQALTSMGLIDQKTLDQAVTEQIAQLQEALRKSNQQLEQRVRERTAELQNALIKLTELNQLKSNFVSNISHELRTPLAHIIGYIDLFASEAFGPLTGEQLDALKTIEQAYQRLQTLIDNLLEFSMLSQGQMSFRPSTFDLREVFEAAISKSQAKADAREVHLSTDQRNGSINVTADREKITWVLEQLLDNAIKFNKPGGRVRLTAREEANMVTIGVTDTGIGIPDDSIDEAFESFHQLDSSSTRHYGGTGLGLTMVKRIIEAHGSKVRVESVVDKGSRFEFSLPVDAE